MTIRLDKCCTFGMLKIDGQYQQFEPSIFLDHGKIPSIPIGSSFTYLGKLFNFEMKNNEAKEAMVNKLSNLLKITNALPIRTQLKLNILNKYIHTNLVDDLKKYSLGVTWIRQNLDSQCYSYVRIWLGLPPSACIKETLTLSKKKCGFGISSFEEISEKLKLKKRFRLKNSSLPELQQIWLDTTHLNATLDRLIESSDSVMSAAAELHRINMVAAENHLFSLEVQGASTQLISENISKNNILIWNKVLDNLPQALFRFTRKAMQQVLPTNSNLAKWNQTTSSVCSLYGAPNQTNKHVLSNCSAALDRYTIRHNNILLLLAQWIQGLKSNDSTLCVDIDGATAFQPIDQVFQSVIRPDLVLFDASKVAVLELTICHESNILKSRSYKLNKYSEIKSHLNPKFFSHNIQLYTAEISVLGFISNLSDFCNFTKLPNLPNQIKTNIIKTVITNSFNIYCRRNTKNQ